MLKRIGIENYRSCLRTSIELETNLSVLIGPNGSGKTNILQAIMFLNKMAQEDRYAAAERDTITASPRIKAVFQQSHIQTKLSASLDAYTDESNNDVIKGSHQKWAFKYQNGKQESLELPLAFVGSIVHGQIPLFDIRRRQAIPRRLMRTAIDISESAGRALTNVSRFCRGIRYYGASQFTNPGSSPVSFEIEQEGSSTRLYRLRGHARLLYDMYSARESGSTERYAQFIDIVGPKGLRLIDGLTFRKVPTSSIDYSVRVGGKLEVRRRRKLLVIPQFRIGKQRLSPNQLSEGTFKTLALLFHVITADSTALLIEEPEVCVHHGLLSSILELIKTYSQRKMMILSTHSDYVLDHVSPENVFLVRFARSGGTVARQISKTMTVKEFSALREYLRQEGNLGEYWREGGLGDRP